MRTHRAMLYSAKKSADLNYDFETKLREATLRSALAKPSRKDQGQRALPDEKRDELLWLVVDELI